MKKLAQLFLAFSGSMLLSACMTPNSFVTPVAPPEVGEDLYVSPWQQRSRHDSRGATDYTMSLDALAPAHTGLTTLPQPDLYWYLRDAVSDPIEFRIQRRGPDGARTVYREFLEPSAGKAPGVKTFSLAEARISLAIGPTYRWVVLRTPIDGERRTTTVASGLIERIEPDAELLASLERKPARTKGRIYAQRGIWYDALMAFHRAFGSQPHATQAAHDWTALLDQVGLVEAASAPIQ